MNIMYEKKELSQREENARKVKQKEKQKPKMNKKYRKLKRRQTKLSCVGGLQDIST